MSSSPVHTPIEIAAMLLAVVITIVFASRIIHHAGDRAVVTQQIAVRAPGPQLPPLGVHARLSAGDETVERDWPTLDLNVPSGQPVDPELPAGAFEGEFIITFAPGKHRRSRLGAELQNGSIIILREGDLLHADHAGDAPKLTLANQAAWLPRKREQITFLFKGDGHGAMRVRAMWQPEDADEARPIPGPPGS